MSFTDEEINIQRREVTCFRSPRVLRAEAGHSQTPSEALWGRGEPATGSSIQNTCALPARQAPGGGSQAWSPGQQRRTTATRDLFPEIRDSGSGTGAGFFQSPLSDSEAHALLQGSCSAGWPFTWRCLACFLSLCEIVSTRRSRWTLSRRLLKNVRSTSDWDLNPDPAF